MKTNLCHMLGIEYPIIAAPMGPDLTGPDLVVAVLRCMGLPLSGEASGDIDAMALLAGQGVGLVRAIKPAGQIVHELVEEARQIIAQCLFGLVESGAG